MATAMATIMIRLLVRGMDVGAEGMVNDDVNVGDGGGGDDDDDNGHC